MHRPDFIRLCLELGVLRFGDFRLKSGRQSPYFFNAGLFNTGRAIAALGRPASSALSSVIPALEDAEPATRKAAEIGRAHV